MKTPNSRVFTFFFIAFLFITNSLSAQFAGGSGTQLDPWQISTPAQLNSLSNYLGSSNSDKYFIQINDIDLTNYLSAEGAGYNSGAFWLPIGDASNLFKGKYNGDGYTISNLKINRASSGNIGLFGYIGLGAILENVQLINATIIGGQATGTLVGADRSGEIHDCGSTGGTVTGGNWTGGLVGFMGPEGTNYSFIRRCFSTGTVTSAGTSIGGLAGNCGETGSTCAQVIENSYSTATVNGGTLGNWVGGLVGSLTTTGWIMNCYSTGKPTGGSYVGGFMGGIVSLFNRSNNNFWDTDISGTTYSGGNGTYQDLTNSLPPQGRTTAQMKTQSTYTGWDFVGETANGTNDFWAINSSLNSGYPLFTWQLNPGIKTSTVSDFGSLFATVKGNITHLGLLAITQHGFCWNTSGNPTIADNKKELGNVSVTGAFTSLLEGLTSNTTYYIKAYATNETGTVYGNEVNFKTSPLPPTVSSFTPTSGPIGTTVTITGTGFNTTAANNIVFFGATKANVTAATATSLTVGVPAGASYQNISITDVSTGLTGYSAKPFSTTSSCGGGINASSFSTKTDFITGTYPFRISITDLNADGKPEMVVATRDDGIVSVFRNTSTTDLISFGAKVDYTTGLNLPNISTGDLDGDGKPDIVVSGDNGTISILRNTSSGGTISFATKIDYSINGSSLSCVSIGDFDADGKPDLAIVNNSSHTISVLRNTSTIGTISFATKLDFTADSNSKNITIGDLDNDGKPEIIIANTSTNTVSILRNTSTNNIISFATKVDCPTGDFAKWISIGDLDSDGKPDLAIANENSNTVSLLHNTSSNGVISFSAKVDYTTGSSPSFISIADLDSDGKPDLITANWGDNSVSVLRNTSSTGTFSFASKVDFATGQIPTSVFVNDLDGDGKTDIVTPNLTSNTFSVIRGLGAIPAINTMETTVFSGSTFKITPADGTNGFVPTGTTYTWTTPTVTGNITGGVFGSGTSITGNLVNSTTSQQTATYTVTPGCSGSAFTLNVKVDLPSNVVVTSNADSGSGTLREAIENVGDGDTITFANDMTIILADQLSLWSKSLTIDAKDKKVTISGNNSVTVFSIGGMKDKIYNLNGLIIIDGKTTDSGGGIYTYLPDGTLNVTNCTFRNNNAKIYGGGAVIHGNGTLKNCIFIGNSAQNGGGACIYKSGTITDCTFTGNSASESGGGVFTYYNGTITGSTFKNNSALLYGGGASTYSDGTYINNTFINNSSSYMGGGASTQNNGTFTNCSFNGNTAPSGGNGVFSESGGTYSNCIFWDNGNEISKMVSISLNYCAVKDGYSGTGNVTLTATPFVNDTVLALNKNVGGGLLCIDKGLNSANLMATDFLGNPRIQNNKIDIGAFESMNTIDQTIVIADIIVSTGVKTCFNAYDAITVAGNTTVIFQSGSSNELIAGKSIRFLPGFYSQNGSFLYAHITIDSTFCDGGSGSIVEQPAEKSVENQPVLEKQAFGPDEKSLKVYPNPNNGQFTLEFTNIESRATVSIYNMLGAVVYQSTATNQARQQINLAGIRKGVYFLNVLDGKKQFTRKIVVD